MIIPFSSNKQRKVYSYSLQQITYKNKKTRVISDEQKYITITITTIRAFTMILDSYESRMNELMIVISR